MTVPKPPVTEATSPEAESSTSSPATQPASPTLPRHRSVRCALTSRGHVATVPLRGAESGFGGPATPSPESPQRFVDQGLVASGGMGSVHLAYDRLMLRHVALKFLNLDATAEPLVEQQFIEEAQITAQLDHPNIVPVYDLSLSSEHNRYFFSMKFVDGKTYGEHIAEYHANPSDPNALYRLLQVFLRVCEAIAFAHERGVIHCDLKPDNVMVGAHGQVYVMDWGVAVLRDSARPSKELAPGLPIHVVGSRRKADTVGGTFGFMSPEQAWGRSEEVDERTDVYGLGGILYYLLTLQPPHDERANYGDFGEVTPVAQRTRLAEVPPALCAIAERALSVQREQRYPNADTLREAVEGFLAGGGWFGEVRYAAGETILREGEPGDSAFIITEGHCEVLKGFGAEAMVVRTLEPGDVFGELAVLTNGNRSASVVAKTAVALRVVNRASLERELRRNPLLGSFMRAVAGRFRDLEQQLQNPPSR